MGEDETVEDTQAAEGTIDPLEVLRRTEAGEATLVDVRSRHEWDAGRIGGATHVQLNDLTRAADDLGGAPLIFYCRGGRRSEMAATAFREAGRDAVSMAGGLAAWTEAGLPLDPDDGYVAESGSAAAVLQARRRNA